MQCRRCGGLMAAHTFSDGISGAAASGWRCLQCGACSDADIEVNRATRYKGEARLFTKERRMRPTETEIARRDQSYIELERTLRAMDRLPFDARMTRLRELAAGRVSVPMTSLGSEKSSTSSTVRQQNRQNDQRRHQQLKRLSHRFWLSRHAAMTLRRFVNDRIAKNRRHVLRISASCERLSPLQQIVWNIAPFFIHSRRTFRRRAGQIAWEELVQFLYLSQDEASTKIVNPTSHLRNEANRLRVIYQQIHSKAPETPYAAQILNLLARHSGTGFRR